MIGGLLLFGILGLILGPLILSYLLVILEIYRNKNLKKLMS
jgi:predicted PurR-regulated permease PerM